MSSARPLVHEGLGTPAEWNKCGENALTFAQRAVMIAIGEERWNLLKRNVEYHLQISDLGQQDGLDTHRSNPAVYSSRSSAADRDT